MSDSGKISDVIKVLDEAKDVVSFLDNLKDVYSKLGEKNKELKAENAKMKSDLSKLETQNKELNTENTKTKSYLGNLETENKELNTENAKMKGDLEHVSKELEKVSKEFKHLTKAHDRTIDMREVLTLSMTLLTEVFGAQPHSKLLFLLHGKKAEMTRDTLVKSSGISPAMVRKALADLNAAKLVEYDVETSEVKLLRRIY